ncbi:polysaccharide pyruvyl transferase family protein [Aurantiacibacter zhengii]|uniref:Polysaccharide pyruvyl transferase domain-containing protein n=1 Tax=Aurantiacibacter zhengii TaxID=2307003 RepID=A0A418NNN7_9SPHN|nr:polysaccharide pyruvyl transferase family protein [Aurantiacibacter zhengii]RIV83047.1 hypothetical protein D2V07_17140 [Aurantiacibacter zhengii]
MNIEISGVFPANRGALLMLEAVKQQLKKSLPNCRISVPLRWPTSERLQRGVWSTQGDMPSDWTLKLLEICPQALRERAGYIRSEDIDVLLDASGFGYGDFWGLRKLERRLSGRLENWKDSSKKAILLPQALGPFAEDGMAAAFAKAVDKLDLVYVRDEVSMQHVIDVLPQEAKIRKAPDFTNLLAPDLPARLEHLIGTAFVIPNEKMVHGKGNAIRAQYLSFLVDAVEAIRKTGREPAILLHEGQKDLALARELNSILTSEVPVIDEPDALVTKALIGRAELIVSSRFHGLVSALSAGVPALACGWSHKYRELMADYGCPQLLVELGYQKSHRFKLGEFLEQIGDPLLRENIVEHAQAEKAKSRAMWDDVHDLIKT